MYRIFLSTLDSGAMVRYSIFNPDNELLFSSKEFNDELNEFDRIDPVPGSTTPFKLVIEYKAEVLNEDQCPIIEIHFVLTPYSF